MLQWVSAQITGGRVGLRAVNAITYFDNFLVSAAEISRSTYAIAGQTIATRISGDPVSSNNGLFYIFSDHLGSTSVLATSTGSPVPGSRATYYPFGSPRTTPTQTITDRNFTGQKENMELGLIYYNARYYVPGIARFLTPDPIISNVQNSQTFNHYSYVRNSPLNRVDPSGHVDCDLLDGGDDTETCKVTNPIRYNSTTQAGYHSTPCDTCGSNAQFGHMQQAYEVFKALEEKLGRPLTYTEVLALVAYNEFGKLLNNGMTPEEYEVALEAMARQFYDSDYCGASGLCTGDRLWRFLASQQGWYDTSVNKLYEQLLYSIPQEIFDSINRVLNQPYYNPYGDYTTEEKQANWRSGDDVWGVPYTYGNLSMLSVDVRFRIEQSGISGLNGYNTNTIYLYLPNYSYIVMTNGQCLYWTGNVNCD